MLLALRAIVDADVPVPIRIGVNRGAIFAGDIGPFYRRTYTVMGDAVNLAARLMAKAGPRQIYATADVLDRSNTLFATTALEPFMVKGKAKPIQAWAVGPATGSRTRQVSLQQLPLIGRDAELEVLREALDAARAGTGRMVEIVGEAGVGKSRLLEALREEATGFRALHAVCEAYTASTPYAVWQEMLRELLDFGRDDTDEAVSTRVREIVASRRRNCCRGCRCSPSPSALEVAATPEVEMLDEKNRRPKLHETVVEFLTEMLGGPALLADRERASHRRGLGRPARLHGAGRRDTPVDRRRCASPDGGRFHRARCTVRDPHRPGAARRRRCAAPDQDRGRAAPVAGARARSRCTAVGRQSAVPPRPPARGDRFRRHRRSARVRRGGHDGADRRAAPRGSRARPPRGRVRADVPPAHARVARHRRRRRAAGPRHVAAARRTLRRGGRRVPALPSLAVARRGLRGAALQAPAAIARRRRAHGWSARWSGRRKRPTSCRCTISSPASTGGVAVRDDRREAGGGRVRVRRSRTHAHSRALDAARRLTDLPTLGTCRGAGGARRLLVPVRRISEGVRRLRVRASARRRQAVAGIGTVAEAVEARGEARQVSAGAALGRARRQGGRRHAGCGAGAAGRALERVVRDDPAGRGPHRRRRPLGRTRDPGGGVRRRCRSAGRRAAS